MGIFSSILNKLGFGDDETEKASGQVNVKNEVLSALSEIEETSGAVAMPEVDVVAQLDALADAHSDKLDWKVSIVDLMKLLGLDSSYGHRKELAHELNCPEDKMHDSAKMNVWLHKQVMVKLAENGGNIPQDLLA